MDLERSLDLCPFSQGGHLQTPSTLVIPALATSQASADLVTFLPTCPCSALWALSAFPSPQSC